MAEVLRAIYYITDETIISEVVKKRNIRYLYTSSSLVCTPGYVETCDDLR